MNEFEVIKDAIYKLFIDRCYEYNKDITITKTNNLYTIVLPLNNPTMPINLFIEADNTEDCINKVIHELNKRDLWRTSYNILKRVKVGNVGF